jgi:hypothetical protein
VIAQELIQKDAGDHRGVQFRSEALTLTYTGSDFPDGVRASDVYVGSRCSEVHPCASERSKGRPARHGDRAGIDRKKE